MAGVNRHVRLGVRAWVRDRTLLVLRRGDLHRRLLARVGPSVAARAFPERGAGSDRGLHRWLMVISVTPGPETETGECRSQSSHTQRHRAPRAWPSEFGGRVTADQLARGSRQLAGYRDHGVGQRTIRRSRDSPASRRRQIPATTATPLTQAREKRAVGEQQLVDPADGIGELCSESRAIAASSRARRDSQRL